MVLEVHTARIMAVQSGCGCESDRVMVFLVLSPAWTRWTCYFLVFSEVQVVRCSQPLQTKLVVEAVERIGWEDIGVEMAVASFVVVQTLVDAWDSLEGHVRDQKL